MNEQPLDYDAAIRSARIGRWFFLGIAVVASISGPAVAYGFGVFEWSILAGGLALGAVAALVVLPIFNKEIRRLEQEKSELRPPG